MTTTSTPTTDEALEAFLAEHADARLASYRELVAIPSISALREHAADCRRTAEWIVADLERMGMEHAEASETGGNPIVYADWLHADGAPTVLIYCHYDVQPVDPIDEWSSPPFEARVDGDRILGRGVSDDKGQLHAHLRALEALLATRGRLPVNLKVAFEGEEESSSIHLNPWLEANRDRLAADVAIISDTGFFEGNLPAITVGLRGMMYAQIDVVGTAHDLHSGAYGGTVENPANALAGILAGLKDPDGRILVPGFYDDVAELDADGRAAIAALPFDEDEYRANLGVPALHGEPGYSTLERRGIRPTLDVNGIWGGFQGEGSKTIIPGQAHAKVSCRLVPNQDPVRIFEAFRDHVLAIAPPGVRVTVEDLGGGTPIRISPDHPVADAAARALEETFGRAPVFIHEGGSIPVSASFERILGLPVVLMGFTPPDDGAHAPNEWMDLRNYETSIRTIARLWDLLGERSAADIRA
jgi:acetylornithine deacetylase/succinyl-diaminopimelate desuccinylase-like protein